MFSNKTPLAEREARRVLQQKLIGSGQSFGLTMYGWSTGSPLHRIVCKALAQALLRDSKLPDAIRSIEGMSGQIYRSFINNLVASHDDARYLEIGCWGGSTATAALYGNAAKCLCIDNWSQFGGPKQAFFENIEKVRSDRIEFRFMERDYREVDFGSIGKFNIYMFDGPHTERDHCDAIVRAQPALDQSYILVVDDWNWQQVRDGTLRALVQIGCNIEAWIEVRTTFDNSHAKSGFKESDWHNGYFIASVAKRV